MTISHFYCITLHILYLHPYHNTNKVSMFVAWFYERKSRRTRTKHTLIITRITLQLFFNFVTSINNQDTSYLGPVIEIFNCTHWTTLSSFFMIMICTLYSHILVSKQWYYEHTLNSKNQFSIYIIYNYLLVKSLMPLSPSINFVHHCSSFSSHNYHWCVFMISHNFIPSAIMIFSRHRNTCPRILPRGLVTVL